MPDTSPRRSSRKNSTTGPTLNDIKELIENLRSDVKIENKKLNENIQQILTRVKGLERVHEELKLENRRLKEEIEELKAAQENTLSQTADEIYQRTLRASNLVLFGVPESEGSIDERKEHDEQFCNEMLTELLGSEEEYEKLYRIGRLRPGVPRPLCLRCESVEQKNRILRSSKGLRSIEKYKSVYINPDRTPMQLEKDKKLREELKRQKLEGKDVIIFREKIIERSSKKIF